ncbi:uncharacterized protein LOC110238734 [Exaiptasia diaphana]|uniref:Uncharacterized protein n=1 Tax=Exaiptasia diaphana TaxID=2652724 RepID=A0A913X7K6_EXADI|nr:uncharacterized protein LOC110238734 [Exaiptasia diaphana]KXJ28533.1 hypothetical protein AC249_AIPGENE17394 [Exaiptasia diaphana]
MSLNTLGNEPLSIDGDNKFYDDIFSALKDMESFLKDIKLAPLSERQIKERNRVEQVVHNLQLKIAEHVHEIQRINGVKSPRPARKNSPHHDPKDKFHFNFHELSAERSDLMQARMALRTSYSPEAKRRLETAPKIRPRSISCPEIRYTPPHSWKTSLPKVPENEEFKEDDEKENKVRK